MTVTCAAPITRAPAEDPDGRTSCTVPGRDQTCGWPQIEHGVSARGVTLSAMPTVCPSQHRERRGRSQAGQVALKSTRGWRW